MKMKLTRTALDKLSPPETGYKLIWDSELPNFGLRITAAGARSYIVQRRIEGRERRITIRGSSALTPEQARNEARKLLGQIATGIDPLAVRARRHAEDTTLSTAVETFIRKKQLKPSTVAGLRRMMGYLGVLTKLPITRITPELVERNHAELGKRGPALANLAMRYLRAVLNFAAEEYRDASGKPVIEENAVRRAFRRRDWFRVERRETFINPHEIKPWVQAVLALDNPEARDYFILVLLTGLRRNEALGVLWADVSFRGKTLTVRDTKNGMAHTLPLSDYLLEMLERRKSAALGDFVFEGPLGRLSNLRYAMDRIQKESSVTFCVHDLRRTFATVADSLDVPAYAVKGLLNHKGGNDVTAGYVRVTTERLRVPMQKITNYFLTAGGIRESAEIVPIGKRRKKAG